MVRKGGKSFIKKGEGQHFYLVHRSQTDEAYGNDEKPSDYVLIPSNKNDATQSGKTSGRKVNFSYSDNDKDNVDDTSNDPSVHNFDESKGKDHITPLGFNNDGYDYTQHLKVLGGGKFIGKDGKAVDLTYTHAIELPEEVLPSANEMERDLAAITLDHNLMDHDLAAALFDDADSEGEFEELHDDFVMQCMQEPIIPDFDFEAHMAKLIAASERNTRSSVNQGPRGWENENENKKSADDECNENDEDEDGEFESYDEEDDYDYDEDNNEGTVTSSIRGSSKGNRILDDNEFDRLLDEQYGEDDLGYIEDVADGEVQGTIDFEEMNEIFEEALDEYLASKEENKVILVNLDFKANPIMKTDWNKEDRSHEVDVKEAAQQQQLIQDLLQQENDDSIREEKAGKFDDLITCQEYLREVKVEEEWDCESVLSTYSTLDNHPSLIKEPSNYRKYKSRYTKSVEEQERKNNSLSTGSVCSSGKPDIKIGTGKAARIVLKGKHAMPVVLSTSINLSSVKSRGLSRIVEDSEEAEEEEEEKDEASADGLSSIDDGDEFASALTSRKGETSEQRKARKSLLKLERREKRAKKKQTKLAYNTENVKQIQSMGRQQEINSIPVFKY